MRKAVDGIKPSLIKYLLSHCTSHPKPDSSSAATMCVQDGHDHPILPPAETTGMQKQEYSPRDASPGIQIQGCSPDTQLQECRPKESSLPGIPEL